MDEFKFLVFENNQDLFYCRVFNVWFVCIFYKTLIFDIAYVEVAAKIINQDFSLKGVFSFLRAFFLSFLLNFICWLKMFFFDLFELVLNFVCLKLLDSAFWCHAFNFTISMFQPWIFLLVFNIVQKSSSIIFNIHRPILFLLQSTTFKPAWAWWIIA